MIKEIHEEYIKNYSEEKFRSLMEKIHPYHNLALDFRIAETPVFVPESFKGELLKLLADIGDFLGQPGYSEKMKGGLPEKYRIPGQDDKPAFVAVDCAVCEEDGKLAPRLIEMQGIASLYFYQKNLNQVYQEVFPQTQEFGFFYGGLSDEQYVKTLSDIIIADEDPENVVMMDIAPTFQKTRIDFHYSTKELGIEARCISEVKDKGGHLFYEKGGKEVPVNRIYNRFIFDELERRPKIQPGFDLKKNYGVKWNAHPNWYFLISKYCLPFMDTVYVPKATLLSEYGGDFPSDLENYVLKPLYGFAGVGVEFDVTLEKIRLVDDPTQWVLQKKVNYATCVPTLDAPAKVEIRLLCVWDDKGFRPLLSLARLSKGKILGVDFNKDKTWVGSSAVFFVPGF